MRTLLNFALGAAAGYSLARAIEARSMGIPMGRAFKLDNLLTPVGRLAEVEAILAAKQPIGEKKVWDPDALIMPSWAR